MAEFGPSRKFGEMNKARLDSNDRDFLDTLQRLGTATIQEICTELGVTATAIRQKLNRLLAADLVIREKVRVGRGRPHHVYKVTETGLRELGDNYADLAMVMWSQLKNIDDEEIRNQIISNIRQSFVERYKRSVNGESLEERFKQLKNVLEERGYDVEVNLDEPFPILRENNCPFHELASSDPSICEFELSVIGEVLGKNIQLTQCCLDGDSCCEFQPQETPSGAIDS